jgi:hypothetical protein
MANGVNTESLFLLSKAFMSTVNTRTNVRIPSHRIAQPGCTPGDNVWAPPSILFELLPW